ncbi:MAG: hypothetical protein U1E17_11890 [Geminicoccaceae bacterium]
MGQIIEFDGRRRSQSPKADAPGETQGWQDAGAAYLDAVLAPWELWRGLMASYASLWFAPLGLEVRPASREQPEPASRRVTQC